MMTGTPSTVKHGEHHPRSRRLPVQNPQRCRQPATGRQYRQSQGQFGSAYSHTGRTGSYTGSTGSHKGSSAVQTVTQAVQAVTQAVQAVTQAVLVIKFGKSMSYTFRKGVTMSWLLV